MYEYLPQLQGEKSRRHEASLLSRLVAPLLALCFFVMYYWNIYADVEVTVEHQGAHGGGNQSLIVTAIATAKTPPSSPSWPTKQETENGAPHKKKDHKDLLLPAEQQQQEKGAPDEKLQGNAAFYSAPKPHEITIDMLTIGSSFRPENLVAQAETFGSHAAVRLFWPFTEANDTEASCATDMTLQQAEGICEYCRNDNNNRFNDTITPDGDLTAPYSWLRHRAQRHMEFRHIKKRNKPPASPMGWMCAQKRPVDAVVRLLNHYQDAQTKAKEMDAGAVKTTFPDYVMVMDDDTFINMEKVLPTLAGWLQQDEQQQQPPAVAAAGCLILSGPDFHFPYGGWGSMMSRGVLQNFLRPIDCSNVNTGDDSSSTTKTSGDDDDDDNDESQLWMSRVCRRLEQNLAGEQHFFRRGMSVKDLMYAYTFEQPLVDYENWHKPVGFCMHSEYV